MQFIDLKTQYERIESDIRKRIDKVLQSQTFIMGSEVGELEERLADYVGVRNAITCSSGTDALLMALMAFGLERNSAVFVPSFTFFASAESISLAGGIPVFVDCDPDDFNISISSLETEIQRVLTEGLLRPRGIIAVDLFGQPADYDALQKVADSYGLFLIEDAAQGFGSTYQGKKAGSFGTMAATSFFPAKPLGCFGDGGAVFTNDDEFAEVLKSIRIHGQGIDKYDNVRIGINGRMDTVQAAILLAKLAIFDSELETRNQVALSYHELLHDVLTVPMIKADRTSAWAQYSLLAKDTAERSRIINTLKEADIPSAIYYSKPIHLSEAYKNHYYQSGSLPVCEDFAQRIFSIPFHPYLSIKDIKTITSVIRSAL